MLKCGWYWLPLTSVGRICTEFQGYQLDQHRMTLSCLPWSLFGWSCYLSGLVAFARNPALLKLDYTRLSLALGL